jgi:hypothetical protein
MKLPMRKKISVSYAASYLSGKEIDKEKEQEVLEKIWQKLLEIRIKKPKAYDTYVKRENLIEEVLEKNSLCKIFCLIVNGINYNDAIAKEYYKNKDKKFHNPKVTAIYLKQLREAGFIKRGEKQGRKQIYEIDWRGIFDILLFRNILNPHINEPFSISHYFYSIISSGESTYYSEKIEGWLFGTMFGLTNDKKYSEKQIEKILNDICFKFFKLYIEEYISLKLITTYTEIKDHYRYWELDYSRDKKGNLLENIELIDFNILKILEDFDTEFTKKFPDAFKVEFYKIIKNMNNKNIPDYLQIILRNYKAYYECHNFSMKMDYNESEIPNPKYKLKNSFIKEFEKSSFKFDEVK